MGDEQRNEADIVDSEDQRLCSLYEMDILDTAHEASFDDLLTLATQLCEASLGAITLVDESRVFHKSALGFEAFDIPRSASICDHTIRNEGILLVEDALSDERFQSNEGIIRTGVRFYAGVPISSPSASRLGTICVVGREPRRLSVHQQESLLMVGRQVSNLLTLRAERRLAQSLTKQLNHQQGLFETYFHNSPIETHLKDGAGKIVLYNRAFAERFRIGMAEWIGKTSFDLLPHKTAAEITAEESGIRSTGRSKTIYVDLPDGEETSHWRSTRIPCSGADEGDMLLCVSVNITDEIRSKRELEKTKQNLESARSQLQVLLKRDDVTNLQNRRGFEANCLAALFALQTSGQPFAVIEIEIGALSLLNRRLGPHVVDELLRDIGHAVQQDSFPAEAPARIAGGSFRILIVDTSLRAANQVVDRVTCFIEAITWSGGRLTPKISLKFFANRQMHAGDIFSAPAKAAVKHSPYKVDVEGARRRDTLGLEQAQVI